MEQEQWFDEMDLDNDEKEKRKELSDKIKKMILLILVLVQEGIEYRFALIQQYKKLIAEWLDVSTEQLPDYLNMYVERFADYFVDVTEKHRNEIEKNDDKSKLPFVISTDRALMLALNEANTIQNYVQFIDAVKERKQYKQWCTMQDKNVRDTHREVNKVTIPILQPFEVGGYEMMFPRDSSLGAGMEEIANCRCTLKYIATMR